MFCKRLCRCRERLKQGAPRPWPAISPDSVNNILVNVLRCAFSRCDSFNRQQVPIRLILCDTLAFWTRV